MRTISAIFSWTVAYIPLAFLTRVSMIFSRKLRFGKNNGCFSRCSFNVLERYSLMSWLMSTCLIFRSRSVKWDLKLCLISSSSLLDINRWMDDGSWRSPRRMPSVSWLSSRASITIVTCSQLEQVASPLKISAKGMLFTDWVLENLARISWTGAGACEGESSNEWSSCPKRLSKR